MKRLMFACVLPLLAASVAGADTFQQLAFDNATVQPAGPRTGTNGKRFYNVEGDVNGSFVSFGIVRWDSTAARSHFDSLYGAGNWVVDSISLSLTESNATFSHVGGINVSFTGNDSVDIQPGTSPLVYVSGGNPLGAQFPDALNVINYTFPTNGNVNTGQVDTYSLYNSGGSNSAGALALLSDFLLNNTITLLQTETDPTVAATYAGFSNPSLAGPTLAITASAIPEPATLFLLASGGLLFIRRRR